MAGPYPYPEPFPQHQYPPPAQPYPDDATPAHGYPGMLPPPVQYPKRRRWTPVVFTVVIIAAIAGVVAALVFANRNNASQGAGGPLTDAVAQAAIQGYLDAMSDGDTETIARNTLCGLYDDVTERRTDLALASLASDAFRKQFSRVEVTSIDRIVTLSNHQSRVLFTMRVAPASVSTRGQQPVREEEQAIAEILTQGTPPNTEVLVCSYLLRTGAQY